MSRFDLPSSGLVPRLASGVRALLACCPVLLPAPPGGAQEEPTFPTIKLVLRPAALPSPALRYHLLPTLSEQTAGDAAPLYREAAKLLQGLQPRGEDAVKWSEQQSRWEQMPLKELPRAEVRRALEPYAAVFRMVERAARCERC